MVVDEATVLLPLAGVIDIDKEKARLSKEIAKLSADIDKLDKKLGNAAFLAKAPVEVIEEQCTRRTDHMSEREKLQEALNRLAAV